MWRPGSEGRAGWREKEKPASGGCQALPCCGATAPCLAPGSLHPHPPHSAYGGPRNKCLGGAPNPIKVRTSPVSHPTAISPCILGAVYFKPASGSTSLGPPWAQRLCQVYWRWCKSAPRLCLVGALTSVWLHREERNLNVFSSWSLLPCSGVGYIQGEPQFSLHFLFSSEQP